MDPVKTQGVQTWEAPTNLTEARGFVGFLNFYRQFIKGFSKLVRPLHDLTKRGSRGGGLMLNKRHLRHSKGQ